MKFVEKLAIDSILPSEGKARSDEDAVKKLDQLKESIRLVGLIHPIIVAPKDGKYELVAGERRYRAVQELGWKAIPALIRDEPADVIKTTQMSMIENIHRKKLIHPDQIVAAKRLYDEYKLYEVVAEKLAIKKDVACDLVGLYDAPPELLKKIQERKIPRKKAVQWIAKWGAKSKKVMEMADRYVSETLTKDERDRLSDVVDERPDASIDEIIREAKKPRIRNPVTILLPPLYFQKLRDVTKERDMESCEEMAKVAVEEWLDEHT